MIVCHRCGKENQDHYKFCLGCGAELSSVPKAQSAGIGAHRSDAVPESTVSEPTRPGGLPGAPLSPPPLGRSPAGPPPGVAAASPARIISPTAGHQAIGGPRLPGVGDVSAPPEAAAARVCSSCNSQVPVAFKFCGVCGSKMADPEPVAAQPAVAEPPPSTAHALMTLIRPDGSEGGSHELNEGENKIGRLHGEIFENDGYLSPTHAMLIVDFQNQSALIRDLGSLNGVFVKMTAEENLQSGQIIRIGQELLRFDTIEAPRPLEDGTEVMGSPNPGYWGKLTVVIGRNVDGAAYPLLGEAVTLGRERGEINFPDDGYVSGLHARISAQDDVVVLADLGSSNGTFIKVQGERPVGNGSFVLLGQQLFRLTLPG